MAIINYTSDGSAKNAYTNSFPDQFKTEAEKQKPGWVKETMDYFATKAHADYLRNNYTITKNYNLMKGILTKEDFYEVDEETKSFMDLLQGDLELPAYVKHYSIISTPVNELVGEMSKRPDTYKVKAFDDESRGEELKYRTEILQQFIMAKAREEIIQKVKGEEVTGEEIDQMTMDQVRDELDSYTSIAEKWANKVLEAIRAEFNMKELSEEAFRDLTISAREFYHVYEDNSKTGFNVVVENPRNVWYLTTPDRKYISDTSGRAQGAYAAGTIHVMELSEIIEAIPDLTKEEIDYLRKKSDKVGQLAGRESNYGRDVEPGVGSITYDTYDPLVEQTRQIIEAEMAASDSNGMNEFLGLTSGVSAFGYKYVVVRAYWISKKKIGKLTYLDEMDNEQVMLVDENYKNGALPSQVSLEWGWINQWMQGIKVDDSVYLVKPYKLLDYCPVIGTVYESKNTSARSWVDMMKPFQVLYNICMNQLYRLLEKEIGNVASVNIRRIPRPKDGDDRDAIEAWEMEARENGIVFDDDSPENTKAPVSNQSVARNIDLTRSNEIQSRYNLAIQLKAECWELVGMSRQRMGSVQATETATGTNTAIQQSYSQTEPLFVAHEYVMRQLYQAVIDAAQYIEGNKETSTLSYVTSEGDAAFLQVNGDDIKMRDLKVFPTNRPEDTKMFNNIQQLSQAVLQNGGTIYEVAELYSTKSLRELKKSFKDMRDRQIEMQQQAQDLERQKVESANQAALAKLEQDKAEKELQRIDDNYNKEMDRINKKEIAIIQATGFGQVGSEDKNTNGVPDVMELGKLALDQSKATKDHELKLHQMMAQREVDLQKINLEREKLKVERENQKNDLEIAKVNARNRNKPKPSSKK